MSMFSVCLYHIVWATKNRSPWLTNAVEPIVLSAITHKSVELECPVHAINGCMDHIHVAVSVKPSLAVADWVGKVKGVSSRAANEAFSDLGFSWQGGYGVMTFGQKQLPFVLEYIHNQKQHHQETSTYEVMERTEE